MYVVALLTSTLLALGGARLYERCELASDLLELGVRKDHIATWVCIAYHESRFDTAARNPSSGDHGLLQISEIYWCGAGKACGLPCSALRDDDISDDVECALSIYEEHTRLQGNGFLAWVVYPHYCKQNAKKYLADCDISVKNTNYNNIEERARSSFIYDSYPNNNITFSKPVQSVSYSDSDNSVPLFLSIASLLRGKFEQDFERDYNKKPKVNWSHFKIDNVDDLSISDFNQSPNYEFLAPLTTQTTTTTTTTIHPESQYKPIKPWRYIETNQFRRRMMSFNKIQSEESNGKLQNETLVLHTTPRSTTKIVSSTSVTSFTKILLPSKLKAFPEDQQKSNKTCSLNMNSIITPKITTQKSTTISLQTSNYSALNDSERLLRKKVTDEIENRIQTFWKMYSYLTTKAPNLHENSSSKTSLETFTLKPAPIGQPVTQQLITSKTIQTLATQPLLSTNKIDGLTNNLYNSNKFLTKSNEDILYTTQYSNEFTTENPKLPSRRTTKTWKVHQPLFTQRYNTRHSVNGIYTENPSTSRRQKPSVQDDTKSNTTYVTTPSNIQSTTETYSNRGVSTSETVKYANKVNTTMLDPVWYVKINSRFTPKIKIKEMQEIASTASTSTSPTITKTPLSIFDFYLNPSKRTQLPNYKFLFSNYNSSNHKIFSGGTTSAPV